MILLTLGEAARDHVTRYPPKSAAPERLKPAVTVTRHQGLDVSSRLPAHLGRATRAPDQLPQGIPEPIRVSDGYDPVTARGGEIEVAGGGPLTFAAVKFESSSAIAPDGPLRSVPTFAPETLESLYRAGHVRPETTRSQILA